MFQYAAQVSTAVQEELLLGYGDELGALTPATFKYILAGPGGKKSWGQIYDAEFRRMERGRKEWAKENPIASDLATGVGMAAPAVLTMGAAMGPTAVRAGAKTAGLASTEALKRPSFLRRSAQGTAAGGGYGAVYGSGKADGGVEERLAGAVEPGAGAAIMGAAAPIVGAIARGAISHVQKKRLAKKVGIKSRAVDPIQEALESGEEGITGQVREPLPGSILADIHPETRGLLSSSLERLGRFGRKGRKKLNSRADEAGARVGQSLDDALGTPEGLEAVVERMTAERKPILDKLYAQAEATTIQYNLPKGRKLLDIIRSKRVPKGAFTEAQKLLDAKGHVSPQALFKLDADGNILDIERVPDVKEVRAIIDGMQQLIEGQRSDIPGKFKPLGGALIEVQKDMKVLLGDLAPAYREASELAEPTFLAKDAIGLGQKAVGVGMSSARFKAEVAAMKKQHPRLAGMVDSHVKIGMRNRIQDLGERAKTSMAPSPGAAGRVGRFAEDDPATIRLIKDLSAKGLKDKIGTVTATKKATRLFRDIDRADESILTREAMEKNVRKESDDALDAIPNSPGVIENVMNLQFGSAVKRIGKLLVSPKPGSRPGRNEAAVANALLKPADRGAMTQIMQLGHKSERGMVGARRAEALVGGAGLAAGTSIQDDGKTRRRAAAEHLMGFLPERLTGLASAP